MAWSMALESTVLGLPDFAWLLKFLQPKQNFLNHLIAVLWSTAPSTFPTTNVFDCFYGPMAQFELIKYKLLYVAYGCKERNKHSCKNKEHRGT